MGWKTRTDPAIVNDPTYLEPRITAVEVENNDLTTQLAEHATKTADLRKVVPTKPQKSMIVGHRGGTLLAPENTLPSIKAAFDLGYDAVETDVKKTADGYYVIHHDLNIDRMTNGTGNIIDLTLAQIQSYNIDAGNNIANYPNLKIPTFEEWLLECKKYGMPCTVHCELTDLNDFNNIVGIIKKLNMEDGCFMAASSLTVCQHIQTLTNVMPVIYIVFQLLDIDSISIAKQNNFILNYQSSYEAGSTISAGQLSLIDNAQQQGVILVVGEEDDPRRVDAFKAKGVGYIVTNSHRPSKLYSDFDNSLAKANYARVFHNDRDYLLNKSSAMTKLSVMPVSTDNGYYYDAATDTVNCNSLPNMSGLILNVSLGKMKKGDIVELYAELNVTSGTCQTGYDASYGTSQEIEKYTAGKQTICRRFVVQADTSTFGVFIGAVFAEQATFSIADGVTIKVYSNRNTIVNDKLIKEPLRTVIFTDSGALPERFAYYRGDACTIAKVSETIIKVTFTRYLPDAGIALATGDKNGDKYIVKTGFADYNTVTLRFIDCTTGVAATLSTLPADFYVNLTMM